MWIHLNSGIDSFLSCVSSESLNKEVCFTYFSRKGLQYQCKTYIYVLIHVETCESVCICVHEFITPMWERFHFFAFLWNIHSCDEFTCERMFLCSSAHTGRCPWSLLILCTFLKYLSVWIYNKDALAVWEWIVYKLLDNSSTNRISVHIELKLEATYIGKDIILLFNSELLTCQLYPQPSHHQLHSEPSANLQNHSVLKSHEHRRMGAA